MLRTFRLASCIMQAPLPRVGVDAPPYQAAYGRGAALLPLWLVIDIEAANWHGSARV